MRITMVGTGYVGLVSGTCLANTGNDVTCLDVDQRKIDRLRGGECPIYEPGLEELIVRNTRAGRLHFTTDQQQAYERAQVIFICVGTPSDGDGFADLKYVLAAARDIGQAIEGGPARDADAPPVIVVKSTVPVGTNGRIRQAIAERTSRPFLMASNPEFLKEGAAILDFTRPDRVVIGADDPRAAQVLTDLHEPFVRQGNPILVMDIASAEMVKYAANAMLATKISFINEMANLCEAFAADIDQVRRGMCADKRIGNQFLYPGLGYGGSCFPKDVLACVAMGRHSHTATPLMAAVHEVNQRQRDLFVARIENRFGRDLGGKRFAVWGIAFKPGTDDIREAPSLTIMRQLLQRGATVAAHDPAAHETCRAVPDLGSRITYADQPYDALDGADALVICTDWDEFKHPDFEAIRSRLRQPLIFDGRNLYRPEAMAKLGFEYHSIGRR